MPKTAQKQPALPARPQALQQRSQRTEARLLAAAAHILEREGLDAATAPRLAAEAQLSTASIYRRFADKDDLLRLAFLHALAVPADKKAASGRAALERDTLPATAQEVIHALLRQSRQHAALAAALQRFLAQRSDPHFAREVQQARAHSLQPAVQALLAHRAEIRHPDPPLAVHFAVLSAASIAEASHLQPGSPWHAPAPLSDKVLGAELTRQMIAYLRRKP